MYKLTERMLQRFENDLKKYHELFSGKRCETWHLEELIFKVINSDTRAVTTRAGLKAVTMTWRILSYARTGT